MTPINSETRTSDAALYSVRQRVIDAMPSIIDAIIQKAQTDASYLHAKFLLEFAGGAPPDASAPGDEQSLAAMLLRELREEPVV